MRNVTAIILAGGRSSRMGSDKAELLLSGRSFLEIVASSAMAVSDQTIISGRMAGTIKGAEYIGDFIPDKGPASGIHAGLHHSRNEINVVLSSDIPLIKSDLIQAMLQAFGNEDVLICDDGKNMHPLAGLYKKSLETHFRKCIERNVLKMTEILGELKVRRFKVPANMVNQLTNVNTREEYEKICHEIAG